MYLKRRDNSPFAFLVQLNSRMENIALCPRLFSTIIKINNKIKKVIG